jgi:6-phosphogluconolactonase
MKFLIGTYTLGRSLGIYQGTIIEDYLRVEPYISVEDCPYLTFSDGKTITISRGGIKIFDNQSLVFTDDSFLETPSHITYIKEKRLILVANYRLGHTVTYHEQGSDTKIIEVIEYPKGSHAHQVYYKDGRVYVVDLGLDKVYVYTINKDLKLQQIQTLELPQGSGPRHLVISKKHVIYVLTEYSNEIYCFNWDGELVNTYHTIPFNYIKADSSAIKLSHDEKHLYAMNRTTDYLSHFKVLDDGSLELVCCYESFGRHARDFDISNDDAYLVVANQHTSNLTLFERNQETGALKLLHKEHPVPDPTCVLFIED